MCVTPCTLAGRGQWSLKWNVCRWYSRLDDLGQTIERTGCVRTS